MEKLCFTQSVKGIAASDLFHMITQSIKFYIYVLIRARTFEKYDS